MLKSNYELQVLVNGKPLKEFYHNGRNYIEGKENSEFKLRIKNNGYRKILAVPTVDGLSVMDGSIASQDSAGYIIDGRSSMTIDGWRTSLEEVAKFYFTDSKGSYAEKSNKGGNLGVIGLAVFEEKPEREYVFIESVRTIPNYPWFGDSWNCTDTVSYSTSDGTLECSSSQNDIPQMRSASSIPTNRDAEMSLSGSDVEMSCLASTGPVQDIGTGFGDTKKDVVSTASFSRMDNASAIFEIYYNTREQLVKIGIDFREKPEYVTPSAFPGGFCKPPVK